MLALINMSGKWYKREINLHDTNDCIDMEILIDEGNSILLVEDEEDIPDEIEIEGD